MTSLPVVYPLPPADAPPCVARVAEGPPERPARRLLDRVRDAIRTRHYSRATEAAYVGWIRRFILFHGKRHPEEMGEAEIAAFLTHLATELRVSASTQNQALSGILFLYRDVLGRAAGDLDGLVRARRPQRLPVVLTRREVAALLGELRGTTKLMASLLYGSGLRLLECAQLRVQDLDLQRCEALVRDGKGRKDRRTPLPRRLRSPLRRHLASVQQQHTDDLARGWGSVQLPDALERKYPRAPWEWRWQWAFPATRPYHDKETGRHRRHHLRSPQPTGATRRARRYVAQDRFATDYSRSADYLFGGQVVVARILTSFLSS